MFFRLLFCITVSIFFSCTSVASSSINSFPRIWVNAGDKQEILENIENHQWAANLQHQLEQRVDPYSHRHTTNPEYLLSRIPRTWGGNHYTDVDISKAPDNNLRDVPSGLPFTTSGKAPIPTLHRAFDYRISSRSGKAFDVPTINDIIPYNGDPYFAMPLKIAGTNEYEHVPYIARHLRSIYTEVLALGVDSAVLYYLTGKEEYAQLAADILWAFVEPLYYMNTVKAPRIHASGMIITNYLRDARITMPMFPIMYDFVHDFVNDKNSTVFDAVTKTRRYFDDALAQSVFVKLAETVLDKGITQTNWSVLEGEAILYNILAIKDKARRDALFTTFFTEGTSNHDSFTWSLANFTTENIWPETVLYAFDVSRRMLQMMDTIDRNDTLFNVDMFADNAHMLDGPYVFHNLEYPNAKTMNFGDSTREQPAFGRLYRALAGAAKQYGDRKHIMRVKQALSYYYQHQGEFAPKIDTTRLGYIGPLKLLRGIHFDMDKEFAMPEKESTLHLSHAGIVMQRNYNTSDIVNNGLMYYTGGASYVHAHASGIDLEMYGVGMVLGPDFGSGGYGRDVHNTYAVNHASHNTVIVNGQASRKHPRSWSEVMSPTRLLAADPLPKQAPSSPHVSFSCQALDDTHNASVNQRCVVMVRTSDNSGYYLDMFRAKSTGETHFSDYLYHNLGDSTDTTWLSSMPVSMTPQPERYASYTDDKHQYPGWHWFEQTTTSEQNTAGFNLRFNLDDAQSYMHALIPPAKNNRELSLALGPPTPGVSKGYDKRPTQVMAIRQYGEAWDHPYVVVYEPSKSDQATVQNVSLIEQENKVVGAVVESLVKDKTIKDIIILQDSNEASTEVTQLSLNFDGRMAMVRIQSDVESKQQNVSLYIGEGNTLKFQEQKVEIITDIKTGQSMP